MLEKELNETIRKLDDKQMVLWLAYHHHEYSGTLYAFYCPEGYIPTEAEIVKQILQSEFEPDRDEWIIIEKAETIKTLKTE